MGSLRVRHEWVTSLSLCTFMHWRRKWQPTPVFLPGESQGWGAWWAAIYGVAQSRTRLKWFSSSSRIVLLKIYFCFRFEGFINKRNYLSPTEQTVSVFNRWLFNLISIYNHWKKGERETTEKSHSTYITKLRWPTSRLNSAKSLVNSNLVPQFWKDHGQCFHSMDETSNCSFVGPHL